MRSPLIHNVNNYRCNVTLHGRSVYRVVNVSGHNVVRYYNVPGKGDALDIFATSGTTVFACHSGRITRVFDRAGILSGCYLEGIEHGMKVITVYAHLHLKDYIQVGFRLDEGAVIGYVGDKLKDPHVHFELEYGAKIYSARTPALLRANLAMVFRSEIP